MNNINKIIDFLINRGLVVNEGLDVKKLKCGTTNGILYTILIENIPTYVVKIDHPKLITSTHDFLLAYQDINLFPAILYTDDERNFIVYSYITGETHYNRGAKLEWMTILINGLFNKYKKVDNSIPWGRVNGIPRNSWAEFNLNSLAFAQENIGDYLAREDHKRIKKLVNKLEAYHNQEEKYYLHGDAGVHNFVYTNNQLNGIIDPSPLIGPKVYDFTYAFCSSPDSLNLSTLLSLFSLWNSHATFSEERIIEEVLFQLYTRIGLCIKVHPQDLESYMAAWGEWRQFLPLN